MGAHPCQLTQHPSGCPCSGYYMIVNESEIHTRFAFCYVDGRSSCKPVFRRGLLNLIFVSLVSKLGRLRVLHRPFLVKLA